MKKIILTLLTTIGIAYAATDIKQVTETIKPLIAALNTSAKTDFSVNEPNYLPGYGLAYVDSICDNSKTRWGDIFQAIKGFTSALGQIVKGLDTEDWLSFTFVFQCDRESGNPTYTVRQKGGDLGKPDKWEVWINGVLQK